MSRLLPHPVNVTPVAAIALFAGAFLPQLWLALLVPLGALLLSDLLIGFHSTMVFVYVGMAVSVVVGSLLARHLRFLNVAAATLACSIIFFVLTNFGTWLMEGIYPHTAEGLVACFIAALPFFTNSILGDFGFTALLFSLFYLAGQCVPSIRTSAA